MQDKHLVVGNPMPVVDQQTGDIYLQFVTNKDSTGCNPGVNNWQVVSEDNGKTWSVPTNLSDVLTPYNGVLPGPGAALQLTKVSHNLQSKGCIASGSIKLWLHRGTHTHTHTHTLQL